MKSLTESQDQLEQIASDPIGVLQWEARMPLPIRFTIVDAIAFKQEFQQLCEAAQQQEGTPLQLVNFDFQQTIFIDSSGIGALVSCWKLAQAHGIQLVLKNLSTQIFHILDLADVSSLFLIQFQSEPQSNPPMITHPSVRSPLKRGCDILGGLVGLAITAILFLPIAIAIKLDSPGPILFCQTRCSWMGRRFPMWKFRSMVRNAEDLKEQVKNDANGAFFKSIYDPRITRVGRFLRKTSLDELPQFWNVLLGQMSLVGTRPPTPEEVSRYEIPHWQRLDIKPGMTGEWQVNGRSKITDFAQVVKLDLRYQKRWSHAYDLQIILKTILVLFRKNAGAL